MPIEAPFDDVIKGCYDCTAALTEKLRNSPLRLFPYGYDQLFPYLNGTINDIRDIGDLIPIPHQGAIIRNILFEAAFAAENYTIKPLESVVSRTLIDRAVARTFYKYAHSVLNYLTYDLLMTRHDQQQQQQQPEADVSGQFLIAKEFRFILPTDDVSIIRIMDYLTGHLIIPDTAAQQPVARNLFTSQ